MRRVIWWVGLGLLAQCGSDRPPPLGTLTLDGGAPIPAEPCTFSGVVCDGQSPYRCAAGGRQYLDACGGARPYCVSGVVAPLLHR